MTPARSRPIVRVFAFAALVSAAAVAQTPATRSAFAPLTADSTTHAPALRASVSLAVTDAPLSDVIASIAKQASLSLTYDPSLIGLERKISISLTQTPAAQAILRVLENAPIQAMVSSSGQVVLVPT